MKEQVAIKRVKFNNGQPDFIYSVEQWVDGGKWRGFLKDNCISLSLIDHVEDGFMSFDDFHSLPAWEG
jgi:hypothetical protein